jgi:hypothetical protein
MVDSKVALRKAIERLKSGAPHVREEAIKTLEILGDTDALPALADAFATDSEPSLRALAQWAGKSVYCGAIRQELEITAATEEERRQAADILAKAQARKSRNKREK